MSHEPSRLGVFAEVGLDEDLLRLVIKEHERTVLPRLRKLWRYYRNAPEAAVVPGQTAPGARVRLAQETGLPARLSAGRDAAADDRAWRREIVIENDIAWRVHAMVDFMFGKPVRIQSTARDAALREQIERVLDAVWEGSGGIALLQDMSLLGHVYGHVDLVLRVDEEALRRAMDQAGGEGQGMPRKLSAARPTPAPVAEALQIELIEPMRGMAILNPSDYRRTEAYIIHFERELNEVEARSAGLAGAALAWWRRPTAERHDGTGDQRRRRRSVTEIISARWRQVYEGSALVEDGPNRWTAGQLPVVHIQNISQPFRYEGLSEVEPLIPLQDELNTRLSDRASRVTMQSFRMYLVRGLEMQGPLHLAPGRVLTTENTDAGVQAFGGDTEAPGEAAHIQEVREALDKTSGVPPLASGVVRAKIGNLTSANALRITLMGVLSKTARKRVTYGRGMAQMCRLILTALDSAGVLRTDPSDRGVRLMWPDPLPEDVRERVAAAKAKHELGLPAERALAELGHSAEDAGIV